MSAAFRRFRITAKIAESSIITSFHLEPTDGQPVWQASPGQYLTLRIPSGNGTVLKTYSISTDTALKHETRITVKREPAPSHLPNVPDGVGSCWLHDHTEVGTELEIAAPRGKFVLDETSDRPAVLLSGGVGQTPLLSMLHTLAKTKRKAWYLHGCENGNVHAMADEVSDLINTSNGRLQQHVCYRDPSTEDLSAHNFHSQGFIDKTLLQALLPIQECEWYLCGPTAFMVALYQTLLELNVPEDRIAYEFFGKAQSLPELAANGRTKLPANEPLPSLKHAASQAGVNAPQTLKGLMHLTDPDAWAVDFSPSTKLERTEKHETNEVVFAKSGVTTHWSDAADSLLELAEQQGLSPDFSCRSGICGSCVCRVDEGDVEYFEEPLDRPEAGQVLICCARPKGRVVLDL